MNWVSPVANLIGAPSTRHQTKEEGPTGDYTENDNKVATTPSEAHPGMDARRTHPKERTRRPTASRN